MRCRHVVSFLFPVVAALYGCSSKKAPLSVMSLEETTPVAIIRNSPGFPISTHLTHVDGTRVPYKKHLLGEDTSQPVKVPAGVRQLDVTVNSGNVIMSWAFDYDLKAGHTYRMTNANPIDLHVRVRDVTTRKSEVVKGRPSVQMLRRP